MIPLINRHRRYLPKYFIPPNRSDVVQWIDTRKSPWYDAGDVGYLRSDDLSGNGNYALKNTSTDEIILNNDTGIDYTDYDTYPSPSTELTRAEIEAIHDPFVFSTCTEDLDHFRILLYESVPDINPSQGIKILNYVGRYGYVAAVDSNGDYVVDSNGHYAIALP